VWVHGLQSLPGSLFHVSPSPRTTGLARSLLLHSISISCSFLQGTSTCSGVWSSMGCRGTTMVSSLVAGKSPLRCLEHLLPSFSSDFGVCRAVSLTFFSLLSVTAAVQRLLSFLKNVFAEALPVLLSGSALASSGSVLEPAGTGCLTWGMLLGPSYRGHPSIPPLPKPCLIYQIHLLITSHCELRSYLISGQVCGTQ